MSRTTTPSCRLSVLMAGDRRSAVIFRRGPSRQVLMIRWWLKSDTFEIGQWFKGRVFPERSDLSHDGELLVYFAGNWRTPFATWTAVSRPPYFTALALWPKGDTWGGGGRFITERLIGIDHGEGQLARADGRRLGNGYRVERLDSVKHLAVLDQTRKLGWECHQQGTYDFNTHAFLPPNLYRRPNPRNPGVLLEHWVRKHGPGRPGAEHAGARVLTSDAEVLRILVEPDFADWDSSGDLLLGWDGKLFRVPMKRASVATRDVLADAREIADFSALTFEPTEPPELAREWP
jgi:hypothetical protein